MSSYSRLIFSTIDDSAGARELAREMVKGRFAACVNIIPSLKSIYRWQETIEETDEILLIIKTSSDRVHAAIERLKQLHPYEVPEIIVIDIDEGLPAYLDWIAAETSS